MSRTADRSDQAAALNAGPRRRFLRQAAWGIGSFAAALPFRALLGNSGGAAAGASYGPLRPVADETTGLQLLQLPEGFRYLSFGWRGDPLECGTPTPGSHDGMAVIGKQEGRLVLCRNHEVSGNGRSYGSAGITFDHRAPGGCVNLLFDPEAGRYLKSWSSLAGTVKNCAGGPTPWGTWLSCEETVLGPQDEDDGEALDYEHEHGWIFEVPAEGAVAPQPLRAMGRFVHEAVAVDRATGIVYETEDAGTAGFYRFMPTSKDQLAQGGRLQMLKVAGGDDLRRGVKLSDRFDCTWVDIEAPERAHTPGTKDELGVFSQGKAQGGATFARLEGCWAGRESIYLVSTNGGDAECGQVWEYQPQSETLRLVFESPAREVLEKPDNICVSPRGGFVLCEDGDLVPQRMHGLSPDGRLFPFAYNNVQLRGERNGLEGDFRGSEWAGACFSPDGKWLFANLQNPGITVAITGPWGQGLI